MADCRKDWERAIFQKCQFCANLDLEVFLDVFLSALNGLFKERLGNELLASYMTTRVQNILPVFIQGRCSVKSLPHAGAS